MSTTASENVTVQDIEVFADNLDVQRAAAILITNRQAHNLFVALEARRRRQKEGAVWSTPAFWNFSSSVKIGNGLCRAGFNVAL